MRFAVSEIFFFFHFEGIDHQIMRILSFVKFADTL